MIKYFYRLLAIFIFTDVDIIESMICYSVAYLLFRGDVSRQIMLLN